MPALLLHLTAVERLAAHASSLPPEFARALGEDLEYGRFGAALPELPWFGGWSAGVRAFFPRAGAPRFARLYRDRAPVSFGLKAAELVANGALVGVEAGLAFIAGYFTQLALVRALEPMVVQLAQGGRTRAQVEWAQSLMLMQELHGNPLVGTAAVRSKLQVRKASGPRGVGRGLYELMRVASLEALGEAPTKPQVDGWVRGLYVFSLALGSPAGRFKTVTEADRGLYRGPGVDVWQAMESALERTREVLGVLGGLIRRGSFTGRSRSRVLELFPEGAPRQVLLPSGPAVEG